LLASFFARDVRYQLVATDSCVLPSHHLRPDNRRPTRTDNGSSLSIDQPMTPPDRPRSLSLSTDQAPSHPVTQSIMPHQPVSHHQQSSLNHSMPHRSIHRSIASLQTRSCHRVVVVSIVIAVVVAIVLCVSSDLTLRPLPARRCRAHRRSAA